MLNKLFAVFYVFLIAAIFLFATPAWAADASKGAKIFSANCASCHAGGNNLVNATKTLKKDALEKYDMYSLEAVKNQIVNGKNAMPAFGGRLSDEQIEDVATYVLSQADKGW
ncbi:c-type cytochrome [Pleurocapsales cyanobacterium LEGE 06147]|nr:c-type cytochrome [Pleurocapsales cyanobacterium LEGE 06147]